jgi:membrane protein implicated in regulation of membrane protease activity
LDIVFWHWWVLAGLLIVLELVSPRFVFLWLGFAAAAVGFLLLVFPSVPLGAQGLLFGGLTVIALAGWRYYRTPRAERRRPERHDQT